MIERASEFSPSQAAPLALGDRTLMSAGAILREAREAHGLHVEVVAAALKVPAQKIEALEDDDIDALPDPVFARALAASVCRALKIDPAPVLAKLPGAPRAGLADADRTLGSNLRSNATRAGRAGSSSDAGWRPSLPLVAVVGLLLLGAAALFWLPQSAFDRASDVIARWTGPRTGASDQQGAAEAPPALAVPPAGTVVESVAPPPVVPVGVPAVAAPVATSPTASATPVVPTSKDTLVFVARADSWVTVTETGGKQLMRRTIRTGETVGLSGTQPMTVVIGRASGIDVQVRGQPFDVAAVTRGGGVARFEVAP